MRARMRSGPALSAVLAGSLVMSTACTGVAPIAEGTSPPAAPTTRTSDPPQTRVPSAAPMPSATATASATAPSAPPAAPPALEDLVLTSEGLGTIRFGDDPADYDPRSAMLVAERVDCDRAWEGLLWYPVYPDHPFGVGISTEPREIYSITVMTDAISTEEGLRIGATFAEAKALYPEAALQSRSGKLERYVIDREPADLFFIVGSNALDYVIDDASPVGGIGAATAGLDIEVSPHPSVEGCI